MNPYPRSIQQEQANLNVGAVEQTPRGRLESALRIPHLGGAQFSLQGRNSSILWIGYFLSISERMMMAEPNECQRTALGELPERKIANRRCTLAQFRTADQQRALVDRG